LFITPGYRFKAIDALITNFHLPDSTPLLLANAFYAHKLHSRRHSPRVLAGNPCMDPPPEAAEDDDLKNFPFVLKSAYEEAIRQGYRFYSYGDAMFIQ
jgi:S-adenosylmethionine:tRNA ribosyltransferase-isomerase